MSACVFGPVPSRRLGRSLGIDPVPLKTCNWNCVYCQLGRSVPLTNERKDYLPPGEIVDEVREVLQIHQEGEIDWVTFLASGEPTLHARLGRMIREVKAITQIPVAVITNGALLYRPDVQEDLMAADAVLPSLDAGTAALYRAINRPYPECTFDRLVNGLLEFRRAYQGKIWVEVMLVKGLNDREEALRDLARLFHKLQPDQVHLTTPVRPPAEPWVEPPDEQGMQRARSFLREWVQPEGPGAGLAKLSGIESLPDALVAVVSRHPMTEAELLRLLPDRSREEVHRALSQLLQSGRLQVVERYGQQFWASGRSRYG
jgi:wyosine [tRNA(Phe)-imidazoG37] synthetase (radical SAM superfamily)